MESLQVDGTDATAHAVGEAEVLERGRDRGRNPRRGHDGKRESPCRDFARDGPCLKDDLREERHEPIAPALGRSLQDDDIRVLASAYEQIRTAGADAGMSLHLPTGSAKQTGDKGLESGLAVATAGNRGVGHHGGMVVINMAMLINTAMLIAARRWCQVNVRPLHAEQISVLETEAIVESRPSGRLDRDTR